MADSPGFVSKFTPFPDGMIESLQHNYGKNLEQCVIVAKNCKFDITVLVQKFGINPPYVIDIDDLARFYDSRIRHDLKSLAKLFGLKPKGDTMQFKGLHWADMTPEQKLAHEGYCKNDIDREVELFKILLPMMSIPEIELPYARHNLNLYLIPRLKLNFFKAIDLEINMGKLLDKLIAPAGRTVKEIGGSLSFVKLLKEALPEGEYVPVKAGKPGKNLVLLLKDIPGTRGPVVPAFARDDVGFQDLLVHSNQTIRELCKARVAVKSWPNHIKRIRSLVKQAACCNGFLPVPFHYYGSHTGRDSGGEGINLKNLGGRGRAGKGNHPLIGKVRGLIEAPENQVMLISDSAQIEARLLAWIARQDDLVKDFAEGKSPYCTLASKLFNEKIWKPSDEEKKTVEGQAMATKYGFGKDGVLGSGYGMGPPKFYLNCIANESLRVLFKKPVASNGDALKKLMWKHTRDLLACGLEKYTVPDAGEYDEKFIAYLILTYRRTYSRIPEFWSAVEKQFKWVVKYPHEMSTYPVGVTLGRSNILTFWNDHGTVNLQLPSGRVLYYRHCSIDRKNTITWHHGKLWGGSITENVIQAIARDLLVYWIMECEKFSLPVVFHCFDEIVNLVPGFDAKLGLENVNIIMCSAPAWAKGLPLAAEGEVSCVYKK